MTKHLEISVSISARLRKSVTIEGASDGGAGLLGNLLHRSGISNAVEEQCMYPLLSDLFGETRQLGCGRLAVVCPTINR